MQDKVNGDSQNQSLGEISDHHAQQSQDEKKAVQTRTFTRWMNVFLQRSDPPVAVHDLFADIQDGRILMALLEQLSGCKLLYRFRSSPHRIFRLNNISKALAFLDDRHVKLLGIDASGIADGIPSVVLNLVWNIILYFQVKEATRGLQRRLSSSLSSLSMSSYPSTSDLSPQPNDIGSYPCNTLPSKGKKAAREPKYHGKAIKTLLQWVQRCTSAFGVEVHDFGKSWRSGLAFLAMIKSINPALVDLRESLSRKPRENIQLAFVIAHQSLDIPPLLEPEDVSCTSPDEQSIITYVSMFLGHCSGMDENYATEIEVSEIPNFGLLGSVSLGETHSDDPKAKALLKGLEKSSEQLLWKQWARRPSGSSCATSLRTSGSVTFDLSSNSGDIFSSYQKQSTSEQPLGSVATSSFSRKKSRSHSGFKPPSPLDACIASQEIRSWMDQSYSKPRVDESHFSLSSEEGIYSLSALDSDEEEAYSYIMDLNKEVFQPYNQLKRQVPRVEEETAEEIFLNGRQTEESKHLKAHEMLNGSGCKHQEGSLAQNDESGLVVHRKFEWDSNCRVMVNNSREMANNIAVERRIREEPEEQEVFAQSNDDKYCEEERTKEKIEKGILTTHGYNKMEPVVDEAMKMKVSEVASWKLSEKTRIDQEKMGVNLMTFEEGVNKNLGKEKEEEDNVKMEERGNQQSVGEAVHEGRGARAARINTEDENNKKVNASETEDLPCKDEHKKFSNEVKTSVDVEAVITLKEKDKELSQRRKLADRKTTTLEHPTRTTPDSNGGVKVQSGDSSGTPTTSPSFREGILQFFNTASCDVSPLELEMLLVLWILLYCCFILPQLNL